MPVTSVGSSGITLSAPAPSGVCRCSHISWSERCALSPHAACCIGFSRRAHSVTCAECARGAKPCMGCVPGDRRVRGRRRSRRSGRSFVYETYLIMVECNPPPVFSRGREIFVCYPPRRSTDRASVPDTAPPAPTFECRLRAPGTPWGDATPRGFTVVVGYRLCPAPHGTHAQPARLARTPFP